MSIILLIVLIGAITLARGERTVVMDEEMLRKKNKFYQLFYLL